MLWVTNSDRGRKQVELVHFPLPSPPLYLSFVGTATSSLSPNRWVLWNFSNLMLACRDFFFVALLFLLAELECSLFLVCWNCVLSCCCWVLEVVPKFLWNLCFGIIILFLLLFLVWNLCSCSWNPLILLARSRSRSFWCYIWVLDFIFGLWYRTYLLLFLRKIQYLFFFWKIFFFLNLIYKKNRINKIFVYLTNGSEWQMDGMCELKRNQT